MLYADPTEDRFHPEFCPPGEHSFDWDSYARAVWAQHVGQLVGAR